MKKLIFCFTLLLYISVHAQKKLLTIDETMTKARTVLAPENLKQLQFIYGTNDYVYLKKNESGEVWIKGGFKNNESVFLSLNELNKKLLSAGYDTVKSMPAIQFNKTADWIMNANGSKLALNPVSGNVRIIFTKTIADKENVEESNAGYAAYLENHNLFVWDGKESKQVTTDGSSDIVYASAVHRNEFGINKGTFWSNSGRSLAFYRMDQSMVADYPIIDWSVNPAKNTNIKYPMAGGVSHQVTVGVYDAIKKITVYLKTGLPAEQYLTNIAWSPDDLWIYIAVLNREQNHMQLNKYNALSGEFVQTLFEERDDKYVEPLSPVLFLKNNPGQFIWQSNRDGWNHLYLYNDNGILLKQLTRGKWEVTDVKGFDAKGDNLFYVSTEESPLTRNLYQLNIRKGISKRISIQTGLHNTQVSTYGSTVIDSYSNTDNPRTILIKDVKSGRSKTLLQAADPLTAYSTGKLSIFSIKNIAGDDIFCRMFKPVDFDSSKQYPVIVYWYGGPHAQMITNSWNGGSGDYWFQFMAEQGFIAFTIDTRGSDNRGKAFEQSMFRKLGNVQMEDMITGVNYLQSLPYVDKNNMGLFGWSFGGFMTTDFMLSHPGIFKAAVAGGPVINWKLYEVMYTERYMDTPQENPEGYEATDLTKQVEKLKGKLLLIHGLQDGTVVQQNSVNFVKACVDKSIQVDYMIYPGHEHNVIGKDRAHLYQKVTDYFLSNLSIQNK